MTTLKSLCLMLTCIMATIAITSCSSDDDPEKPDTSAISELDQKLLKGIWLSGDFEKGDLFTLEFKDEKNVLVNVVHNSILYYQQLQLKYKVSGNDIQLMSSRAEPKIITVKSMKDNEMVVEALNLTKPGEVVTNTFVRRNPTSVDDVDNTSWSVKKRVTWVKADKDELTLPGNLTFDGKRTVSLGSDSELFKMVVDDDFRLKFNDDQTLELMTTYNGSQISHTYPYMLDSYMLRVSLSVGPYEADALHTLFKTDSGNLFFIVKKKAFVAYTLDYLTLEAKAQGCDIPDDEWLSFASELEDSLDIAMFLLILGR